MVVNAHISLQLIRPVTNSTGHTEILLDKLHLQNDRYHVMTGAWIIKHPLDKQSPLYGKNSSDLKQEKNSILATITGIDGTTSEAINHVYAYSPEDIILNKRFKSIVYKDPNSEDFIVDLTLINEIESTK
jgi:inward rectifier potassium channel